MQLDTIALTHQGLVRDTNQDAILSLTDRGVFTVADGMGGEQAGDEAAAQVIATIRDAALHAFFQNPPEMPEDVGRLLRATLQQASEDVFRIAENAPTKRGMGSTAAVLCLHRGAYFTGNVGDSRIYLVRNGIVRQLTRDHTLVWALYEQGQITRDQLEHHPQRHLLTQCIGAPGPLRIDLGHGGLQEGDLFLICSDGLVGYVEEQRVFKLLLDKTLKMGGRANALLGEALKAGGGDNISIILVRVAALGSEDGWAAAPPGEESPCAASDENDTVESEIDTLASEAAACEGMREGQKGAIGKYLLPGAAAALSILAALRVIQAFLR